MPISPENTRTLITIPKYLKAKLEEEAKKQKRSFNNKEWASTSYL